MIRLISLITLLLSQFFVWAVTAPVPEMEISQLKTNVFLHISYKNVEGFGLVSSNGVILLHDDHSVLIDTPWTAEETIALLKWAEEMGKPISKSISTHYHDDRTAGMAVLNTAGVATYALGLTNRLLEANHKAVAKHAVEGTPTQIESHIEVYYPGPGHTKDNVVVWLEEDNILVGGCLTRATEADSLGYTGDAFVSEWPQSVKNVMQQYPHISLVIPGHGEVGDSHVLTHTIKLAATYGEP
ncbi:subclass B1 metallo-beta-lactamase [Alteromonas pelagimontana]|uniref:beta-lactamase n=1 Tax=Alteromonas pelagimontana TaxID=1858656 RepID=A0A6M4MC67_9ALTE|nr:subclass B1 metallo-beta-lactamase [Alteromonas pelagimontana]QJR80135.1 subclass B1 metallo-beta-lactamase [Alteromonas pelagimontana]